MQQRAVETRERLLDTALACFGRQGYEATSVAQVCAEAGLSKGAFYHHFPSKQALFVELLGRWLASIREQLRAIDDRAQTVPEALRTMAGLMRRVFADSRWQLPLVLDFWSQARLDPEVWQKTVTPFRDYRAYFADLIARGVARGTLHPIDPEVGAQLLVSLAVGLVLQGLLDPDGADWGEVAEQAVLGMVSALESGPHGGQN